MLDSVKFLTEVVSKGQNQMPISMPPFTTSRRQCEQGLTLLEVILSLGIISAATIGMNMIASRYADDTKLTIAASQMRTFGEAAKAYIKDNYATVQAVATPSAPAVVDVPTLIASGYLTTGFMSTNAFDQSLCALVLEPTANRLQAMVVAEGGTAIDDLSLGSLAAIVGGSGGGTYSSDATVIRGAVGGWAITTATFDNLVNNVNRKCNGTAGNVRVAAGTPAMALWFENGDTSSAFLARDAVPGRPELNAMNTPIVMNSVQVANNACANLGAIARSSTGAVLSCESSGLWKTQGSSFWKEPVANWFALIALTGNAVGDVRLTLDTQRAFTWNGSAWIALAVDQNGNMSVPGALTVGGNVSAAGQISVGANSRILGNGSQGGHGATTIAGSKNGWTGVEFRDAAGNYQINQMTNRGQIGYWDLATGRWLEYSDTSGNKTLDQTADWASGRLNPGWAVETWGCAAGQIAKAAYTVEDGWAYTGKTLSCVNGVWRNANQGLSAVVGHIFNTHTYIGRYLFCALGYVGDSQVTSSWFSVYPVDGPDALGKRGWNFQALGGAGGTSAAANCI